MTHAWRLDPEVEPGSVGADAAALDKMAAQVEEALAQGELFHGCQLAVHRGGKKVLDVGGGLARPRLGVPVQPDTMFVIFSSTKGLAALAMAMLYERGRFHYDEPVGRYWESYASQVPDKQHVTIRHVMTHRGGFPQGPAWLTARHWNDLDAIRRAMEEVPLRFAPGSANAYHAMNFGHMVNELIRRIDERGRHCGEFLRDEVFEPLGLRDLYVGLPDDPALEERVAWVTQANAGSAAEAAGVASAGRDAETAPRPAAPAEPRAVPERFRETPEQMHPMNRPAVHQAVLPAGGGIGTARDLSAFYAPLSLHGTQGELRLVRRQTLEHCATPTNRPGEIDGTLRVPIRWGTGWHLGGYGHGSTLRTFGHGGAGGQVGFADRERGFSFAFTTTGQRSPRYLAWRQSLQDLAFAACAGD